MYVLLFLGAEPGQQAANLGALSTERSLDPQSPLQLLFTALGTNSHIDLADI